MSNNSIYAESRHKQKDRTQKQYVPQPSKAWIKNDVGVDKFYTYILKLNDGRYYAGHSRDIRPRMVEHRDGTVASTKGLEPKLQYFEILSNREAAMCRERELRQIAKNNPREIRRLIIDFQDKTNELDFT